MLTNNLDFKRAIAQQFDPDTDYSNFDEAEIDGAFEATVYQLLLERQKAGGRRQEAATETPAPVLRPPATFDFGSIIHQVIKWNNLDIGLEYRPGEVRFPGRRNSRKLRSGYGHIRNYVGADGEALDCYLAPAFFNEDEAPSDRLFQVSQVSPEDGDFDEHKYMLGFMDEDDAKTAYLREMPSDYFGGIREVKIADLDKYRKSQPVDLSETVLSTLLPYLQKIDELTNKVDNLSARFTEFSAPIQVDGEVLSEEEFEAIASVDERVIEEAIKDWEQNAPEEYKELIN